MQNINNERLEILENINIGSMIENFNPSSMQGTTLKKNLSEAFNAGHIQKVSSIIDVIAECSTISNVDNGSYNLVETLKEKLNESIKTKIVFCFEALENYRPNPLHESLKNTLNSLVVLEDAEISTKIRAGALSSYKSFEPVHFIIESVQIKTVDSALTESHKAYHPVSYTEISENHTAFIRLHNKVFAINESQLLMVNSPSTKFAFLSSVVENLSFDYINESFSIKHATLGEFNIFENKISRKPIDSEEIFEHSTSAELHADVSIIVESAGAGNNRLTRQQIEENKKFIDAISAVQENFESISIADNIVVVENLKHHEKFALVINEDTSHVITLQSNRMPNIIESSKDLRNSLFILEKKSGYDAKHFFTSELSRIVESDETKATQIKALNDIVETLEDKSKEIKTLISESKAEPILNDVKLAKLNEAFNINEGMLFEQRTALSTLLNI